MTELINISIGGIMTKLNFKTALINNRWLIYGDGVVYDTVAGKDIPAFVFKIRDALVKQN